MKNLKIIAAVILSVLMAGCGPSPKSDKEEIKIGAIFDVTGSLAYMGKWSQDAATMAVEELNKNGGIAGRKVRLVIEDGGSDANKGVAAFRKLIDHDQVSLVIGFNSSSAVMAAAPIANQNKVVILTSGTGSPNITDAGDYIFRNRLSGAKEVEAISKFIAADRATKAIGVVYINNDYGKGYDKIFDESFRVAGGQVKLEEGFQQNQTDFKSLVKKLKDSQLKSIYLVAYVQEGGLLIKRAYEQDYKPQWYAANPIEAPEFLQIAGKATEGVIYSIAKYDPSDSLARKFNAEYKKRFGHDSEMFAANAYDAVNIGALAIAKTDGSGDQIKNYLYQSVKNYPGVAGITTFDKNGDVAKPVMMKTVKNGAFTVLK
jgi:branched-chain amino acid transport system substrate-binding protein